MSRYVAEGMEVSAAIEKVYKVTSKLARQAPIGHCVDAHKVEYFSPAVTNYEWRSEPLSRVPTFNLNF